MTHDPGGKVRIPLPPHVIGSASFGGPGECYRYALSRTWGVGPRVMFLMMNPSTADPEADDPTVAKCRRLAVRWGYAGLLVGNVFAYRATSPKALLSAEDPVGPMNASSLLTMAGGAALRVAAFGSPPSKALREQAMRTARGLLIDHGGEPMPWTFLRLSKDGIPCHPLYLPESLEPQPWTP